MIAVRRELVPENHMDFNEVCSFTTDNYVGIYDHNHECFAMFEKCGTEMFLTFLDKDIASLEALDEAVYGDTGEHIEAVSDGQGYTFNLLDEENTGEVDEEYVRRAV